MGVAKKMATDFMILSIQKFSASFTRTEALKIHKYLQPGYFLWVASDPRMIQEAFKKLVRSLIDPVQLNATMEMHCKMPTSSIRATSHCSVASKLRHVMMRGEWSVINFDQTMT
jgi:hypothetical protein